MDNTSNFQVFAMMNGTANTTAHFTGQLGHTYYFESIGTDQAGNVEAKSQPDTSTTIVANSFLSTQWIFLIVVVVAAAGGLIFMLRKRKSRRRS